MQQSMHHRGAPRAHAGQDVPSQEHDQKRLLPPRRRCGGERENGDAPEQFTRPLAESVENAIGDIEQPGTEGKKQCWDKGQRRCMARAKNHDQRRRRLGHPG